MQNRENLSERLSRMRQSLVHLRQELNQLTEVFLAPGPLVRGTLYTLKRKCGKPTCRCTRGELHPSLVLSWKEEGKTRLKTVSREERASLEKKTRRYQRFRKARARLVVIHQQMLHLIDEIEKARREEP